ncbi:putative transposase for transposon Tn903 [Erwinia piriflorinigrans CFBP 5888]|uniref:Putative transposase for transposon Tn903 n=1 Tax=Erwinia piriflorinigrans CFBP 5888 TaxID=1161919 RepID=V5Z738_9GAMM|nr:putative transposase for transposon Tn903 [Erwinia piriflorinigrans CFBP 5888]
MSPLYSELAISTVLMFKHVFTSRYASRDAQVGEAMAMIRALNKMTHAGMPESARIG